MTHLVTLASAIVERRGGMLIHGAIIARELGVPCVNGVPDATRLLKNGELVQDGSTSLMLFSFEKIIAYVSQFMTLKTGDLIFTGTPAGVGPVQVNDHLEAYLEDEKLMDFMVK
jgi:2-keto-4-pentenoate hydratase/2-oxohepta-3-ene-1,7-dioic acid hydratase in catechol pathway